MLGGEEREEIKRLTRKSFELRHATRESFELRHANEILKDPSLRPIRHGRIESSQAVAAEARA